MIQTTPQLPTQQPASLADFAYDAIAGAIIDGTLLPGTRLTIDALARDWDISNTPIREALSRLAAERLVMLSANRGFTVAARLTEEEYHQLFEVRYTLEVHALKAGMLDDAATLARIEGIAERMERSPYGPEYSDFKTFNQADRDFHLGLVSLSRNAFLIRAWQGLHFHLHVGRLYSGAGVIDHSEAMQEHREILNALRALDRAALVSWGEKHIKQAESRLRQLL